MPTVGNPVAFTGHSMRALSLSIAFTKAFSKGEKLPVAYTLDLETPSGTSTEGGKHVMQTVKLVFDRKRALAIGSANAQELTAELTPYADVAADYAKRAGGAAFPFDVAQYDALVRRLVAFFAQHNVAVVGFSDAAVPAKAVAPAESRSRARLLLVGGAVAIMLAVGLLLLLLH